ncbi:hypothetical protein ACFQEQ_08675 [Halolamina salina]|uniref:DUF7577 domain-containing protein n=1 Tax=Halolamina salina TaxID=1220023 RepID=UPI00361FA0D6
MPDTAVLWLLLVIPIAIQVPLLWFMMSRMEIDEAPDHTGSDIWGGEDEDGAAYRRRLSESGPAAARAAAGDDGTTRCTHCGTENDPAYRYCCGCARRL